MKVQEEYDLPPWLQVVRIVEIELSSGLLIYCGDAAHALSSPSCAHILVLNWVRREHPGSEQSLRRMDPPADSGREEMPTSQGRRAQEAGVSPRATLSSPTPPHRSKRRRRAARTLVGVGLRSGQSVRPQVVGTRSIEIVDLGGAVLGLATGIDPTVVQCFNAYVYSGSLAEVSDGGAMAVTFTR
jgi:hypothetical protein